MQTAGAPTLTNFNVAFHGILATQRVKNPRDPKTNTSRRRFFDQWAVTVFINVLKAELCPHYRAFCDCIGGGLWRYQNLWSERTSQ